MTSGFTALLTVALATLLLAAASPAAILHIEPDGTGDAPTIQAGIDLADPGDIVELADGVYTGPGNRDIDFLGKAITVRSVSGVPEACVIDCEGFGRGFFIHSLEGLDSVLQGVRIVNGYGDTSGGIYVAIASPTITGCVIEANSSVGTNGSGIYLNQTVAVLEGCFVAGNTGGAIPAQAIFGYNANAVVRNCVFAASPDGDGVRIYGVSAPVFSDCTIVGNSGYGIFAAQTEVELTRTIVAFNGLESISCEAGATVTASCCDVFGNVGGDWVACLTGQGNQDGNFSADPLFCDANSSDFSIQSDSPCAPPGVTGCGLVGALPVGCGPLAVEETSWARIKAQYR